MDKYLYTTDPVRSFITGASECGKSYFLTNLNLIFPNELEKTYIYSPNLHQDIYQKSNECFRNYIPT